MVTAPAVPAPATSTAGNGVGIAVSRATTRPFSSSQPQIVLRRSAALDEGGRSTQDDPDGNGRCPTNPTGGYCSAEEHRVDSNNDNGHRRVNAHGCQHGSETLHLPLGFQGAPPWEVHYTVAAKRLEMRPEAAQPLWAPKPHCPRRNHRPLRSRLHMALPRLVLALGRATAAPRASRTLAWIIREDGDSGGDTGASVW